MIQNLLTAGATLRKTADAMLEEARSAMNEARQRCAAADKESRGLLTELEEHRRETAETLLMAAPLYRLAGLRNPGLPAAGEVNRLPTVVFDDGAFPTAPSAVAWVGIGALAGGVAIAALVHFAGLAGTAGWIAGAAGGAILGAMFGGMLQGSRSVAVAREHSVLARQWHERATSHVRQLDSIRKGAKLSMQLTEVLGRKVRASEIELETIAMDTTNAAVLLKDVLNTALLNEEGAFLEEVIEQLHGQKERIAGFAGKIAVDV